MRCAKCGSENPAGKKFCGDCGGPLPEVAAAVAVEGEPGVYYCAKHKKEKTRVRCGRCETPVCPKCVVHGPVGVRCRECAKNRVPIRPMGVLHSAGQEIGSNAGRTVWYLALWAIVVSFITNLFGGPDS
jgi:hypothetical protein